MVGQSRTRRAHKIVVDRPPRLSRFFRPCSSRQTSKKTLQLHMVDTNRWAQQTVEAISVLLALLESSWSFESDRQTGHWPVVGVAENFQPGFDVSGNEAPVHPAGVPWKPPRLPHLAAECAIPSRQHRGTGSTGNPLATSGAGE